MSTVVKAADKGGPYGLGLEMAKTLGNPCNPARSEGSVSEEGEMPLNTYKNKTPFLGTVKSVERIVGPKATGETTHIIIDHGGKMPFWEGQSYGVIPPGTKINSKGKEVAHGVRLYSIASTRYGDSFDGQTATLCVRRATYWDEEKGGRSGKEGHLLQLFVRLDPGHGNRAHWPVGPSWYAGCRGSVHTGHHGCHRYWYCPDESVHPPIFR